MKLKLSLLLGLGLSLWGQTPYTAIMDTLTPAADGKAVTGSINVSWTEFTYAAATIAQSPTGGATYSVVAGAVDIPLAPTDHSAAPVTYTVKATIGGRAVTTYWSVPTLPSGQCASSSYCTVKEVTVAFPAGPSTVVNPSQISTGSSTPGQVLCNVSGIIGFCSTASGAWGSITGMLDAQADLLAALNAKLGVDANAVSATALAALPSACASGYAPQGVDTGGNALDCQAVGTGGSLPSFNVTTTTTVITLAAGTVHTAANGDSQVGPYTITNSGADTASGAFQVAGATATNAGQCWYSGITLSKWTITFPGSTCINGSPLSATAACVVSISVVSGAVQAAPSQYPCVSVPVITQGSGITVTQGTNVACNAATTSSPGCIEPDGTTCTTSGGVLTCGGGGSSSYQTRADVVMTASQFTNNTPIQLIPAQGAGTIVIPLDMTIVDKGGAGVGGCGSVTFTIGTYSSGSFVASGTTGNIGQFCYGRTGGIAMLDADDINVWANNSTMGAARGQVSYTTSWANLPIYIQQSSTGLTTTDTFPISVSYRVMTP